MNINASAAGESVKVSVIMGIYNCADTLPRAIESILAQTYTNWELILCDDGSTDETYTVARNYQQKEPDRIILLKNETNHGLNYTLNKCLRHAKGTYIARMDGDDYCLPQRFEVEKSALDHEPDIAIVSTDMGFFDESGTWGTISNPDYPEPSDFIHGTPFCHAPCMVRKAAYDKVHGYSEDKKLLRVEDYHLWLKMYKAGFRGKNIHECLYYMRDDRNAFQRRKFRYRLNEAYVRALAIKGLGLPWYNLIFAVKPILVGLMPSGLYKIAHRKRLAEAMQEKNNDT